MNIDERELALTVKLRTIVAELLGDQRVTDALEKSGLADEPNSEWAMAKALLALSDDYAELATK